MSNIINEDVGLGKCSICGREASALYPLLPGSPAFCSKHHNPKDAGPFGCDFTGPDDFDIPFEEELSPNPPWPLLTREDFLWQDKKGGVHPLHEIDDCYLRNIIRFLQRKLSSKEVEKPGHWKQVRDFLIIEEETRREEKHLYHHFSP